MTAGGTLQDRHFTLHTPRIRPVTASRLPRVKSHQLPASVPFSAFLAFPSGCSVARRGWPSDIDDDRAVFGISEVPQPFDSGLVRLATAWPREYLASRDL